MPNDPPKTGYRDLLVRVNKFPQGAPASELLYKILAILFSEKEAALVSRLPLRPFSAAKAAGIWKVKESAARNTLEQLASRAILIDLEHDGQTMFFLPPPMAGFFEFSLMRVRSDIDQDKLAGLFFQYINTEEAFVRDLFNRGETGIGRVFVNESTLTPEAATQVLDYERASAVIRGASHLAVGLCYCRHKMARVGRACDAPRDNCMTLNTVARALIKNGSARSIDAAQGLDILQEARARNLVQCGDNVRNEVNFICHCCSCCCEAMVALRRLGIAHRHYSTNFVPRLDTGTCNGCGNCVGICPVQAIELLTERGIGEGARRKAKVNEGICLGCGVCVANCPVAAIRLEPKPRRIITPVNSAHRLVLMAIERGTLQHLIFDNQAHLSHRVMAAILGAILKLPPVKRIMASRQMKSRYLERIMKDVDIADFSD